MFSTQKFGGVTKYFSELMKNLPEGYEFNLPILISENQYLKEDNDFFNKNIISLPEKYIGKSYIKKLIFKLNERKSFASINSHQYDLFHPTFYNNYFLKQNLKIPFVLTVHDLIEYKFEKKYFSRDSSMKYQMKNAILKAERIIAISHHTKKDLINYFDIKPEKIDVIYHGYNISDKPTYTNKYGDYILFVGKRERYKNFTTFAKAISHLLNKDRNIKLICIGRSFTADEIDLLKTLKILSQTIVMHVDELKLNQLYKHAKLFVFPSLYEGFGMPILEAMANDCPICLSNTSCFPEIADNAGDYFDPNLEESILHSIEKVYYNTEYRNKLIENGRQRLQNFSWKKTALETGSTYRKCI